MQFSYLYMLTNAARTFLYIGATPDLNAQLSEHMFVEPASFSKDIQPVHLIYLENFDRMELAERRAAEVKSWRESQKWKLIMSANPCLHELLLLDVQTSAA